MKLRKIETREEKERRERNRNIIVGLILVFVMILSTAGYAIRQEKQQEVIKYKDFVFIKGDNGWQLQKPFALLTMFNPKEVENIPCNCRMQKGDFENQEIYFVAFNSDEKTAATELLKNLPAFRTQFVCLEGEENKTGCENLPLKNCFDDRIIVIREIKEENETVSPKAYQQNKCLFIESNSNNITMTADRVLFSIYGIM